MFTRSRGDTVAPSTLRWLQADDDVFVATDNGEYAGFIATSPTGYTAHGSRGERLGRFTSRTLAQAAVYNARSGPKSRKR